MSYNDRYHTPSPPQARPQTIEPTAESIVVRRVSFNANPPNRVTVSANQPIPTTTNVEPNQLSSSALMNSIPENQAFAAIFPPAPSPRAFSPSLLRNNNEEDTGTDSAASTPDEFPVQPSRAPVVIRRPPIVTLNSETASAPITKMETETLEDEQCPVCYEYISSVMWTFSSRCKHKICNSCLAQCRTVQFNTGSTLTCPLCRSPPTYKIGDKRLIFKFFNALSLHLSNHMFAMNQMNLVDITEHKSVDYFSPGLQYTFTIGFVAERDENKPCTFVNKIELASFTISPKFRAHFNITVFDIIHIVFYSNSPTFAADAIIDYYKKESVWTVFQQVMHCAHFDYSHYRLQSNITYTPEFAQASILSISGTSLVYTACSSIHQLCFDNNYLYTITKKVSHFSIHTLIIISDELSQYAKYDPFTITTLLVEGSFGGNSTSHTLNRLTFSIHNLSHTAATQTRITHAVNQMKQFLFRIGQTQAKEFNASNGAEVLAKADLMLHDIVLVRNKYYDFHHYSCLFV